MNIIRPAAIAVPAAATVGLLITLLAMATGNPARISADKPEISKTGTTEVDSGLGLVAGAVRDLHQIHVDSMDAHVPASARPLLTSLKHHLRDVVATVLRLEGKDAGPQQVEARVVESLRQLGVDVKEPACLLIDSNYVDDGYDYGEIYAVTVKRPQGCFDMVAVTTTIGICCGEDTSFYLYKWDRENWNLILAAEVDDYDLISSAPAIFTYGISWPDDRGSFFVVTASVNPWCSSNWQNITYRVLQPGSGAYEPRVLFSQTRTIWLMEPYTLDVRGQGFTLRFCDDGCLNLQNQGENDPNDRRRILQYSVERDRVKRKF